MWKEVFLPKLNYWIASVWIIKTIKWDLLMLLEKENKPWKQAGQWSFIIETLEKGETGEEALRRGFLEELWVDLSSESKIYLHDRRKKILSYCNELDKYFLFKAYIFDIMISEEDLEKILSFKWSTEISKVKLFSLGEILNWNLKLRPGIKEVLLDLDVKYLVKNWKYDFTTTIYW